MKGLNQKVDIFFLILITEIFILTTILIIQEGIDMKTYLMFGITFLIVVISFYTNVVIGLLMSLGAVFIYGSFLLYEAIEGNSGQVYFLEDYLWLMVFPIFSATAGKLGEYINELQKMQNKLQKEIIDLITIDEDTKLNNKKSFYVDLEEEMSRAKRHQFHLTIMMIKIQYYDELLSIYGKSQVNEILRIMGDKIELATRLEDKRYRIEREMFAIIMPNTKLKEAENVKCRMREGIEQITLRKEKKREKLNFHFKIGLLEYDQKLEDPFVFKELAEKEIEYDI
ncbi:diguanylate cyclase domain-containing protein [Crassaminicella profunda]|uniref:diguanylate cyclase domain-containing protein n=1 Tax=Crassaminicella profunda TaxID=1286698 RepID=UPI001CA79F45|nr:diguanylate cyclase [Crassaminicella profunda]QZY53796.1 GGDEF domain-containing protein [Crassaminicella profunda]